MAMPANAAPHYWLPSDIWAFPDDGVRRECIEGTLLVTPAPSVTHQRVVIELLTEFVLWLRAHPVARALTAPADVRLTVDSVVQPDVFVYTSRPALAAGHLMLAVEVLSPGTARHDRGVKRRFYQAHGVDEYWIVDVEAQLVERWRPADERPEVLQESIAWHPHGASNALVIDLAALFARALAE